LQIVIVTRTLNPYSGAAPEIHLYNHFYKYFAALLLKSLYTQQPLHHCAFTPLLRCAVMSLRRYAVAPLRLCA
jgi:hypothetical protein